MQNDTEHTGGFDGKTDGTTSYLNNSQIEGRWNDLMEPPRGPYVNWPSLDLALGRVSAHEFAHVFLGPGGHVQNSSNLMGQHHDDNYYPKDAGRFQLDGKQGAKILSGCKNLPSNRPGHHGGGGGGGNVGGGIVPPPGIIIIDDGPPPIEVVTHRMLPPDDTGGDDDE